MTSRYLKPLKRELGQYLTKGLGPLAGGPFECAFQCVGTLASMSKKLEVMPDITWSMDKKGRAACLLGVTKGRQMCFEIYKNEKKSESEGKERWRMDMRFAGSSRSWGSNEAYYNRFRAEAFPLLGVTSYTHLRPTFRRKI